jgi:histidine ammonia-lyase
VDFLAPLKPSKRGQAAVAAIRAVSPAMEKDRVMSGDFERISALLATGRLAELVR